jgi:pSer/pThr/pTyr-binding forkhead associated (FHA) protein
LPKYQKQIDAQLTKVGVQIPSDAGDPPDDAPAGAPSPPARPPIQPIVLGPDANPEPVAVAPFTAPAGSAGSPRRWVNVATGEAVILPDGVTLVTREDGSALSILGSNAVSRRHAEVFVSAGEVRVKDLGSTNGSFLNNVKLMNEVEVSVGDIVQFGDVRFRLEAG